jgi:hypothetical protein
MVRVLVKKRNGQDYRNLELAPNGKGQGGVFGIVIFNHHFKAKDNSGKEKPECRIKFGIDLIIDTILKELPDH